MTGEELKLLRKGKKLQAQNCAKLIGISRVSLYRYEQMDEVPLVIANAAHYVLGNVTVNNVIVTQKKVVNNNLVRPKKMEVEAGGLTGKTRIGVGLKKATGQNGFVPSWDDGGPGVS